MFDGTCCWAGVSGWQGTNVVDIHVGAGQTARGRVRLGWSLRALAGGWGMTSMMR